MSLWIIGWDVDVPPHQCHYAGMCVITETTYAGFTDVMRNVTIQPGARLEWDVFTVYMNIIMDFKNQWLHCVIQSYTHKDNF